MPIVGFFPGVQRSGIPFSGSHKGSLFFIRGLSTLQPPHPIGVRQPGIFNCPCRMLIQTLCCNKCLPFCKRRFPISAFFFLLFFHCPTPVLFLCVLRLRNLFRLPFLRSAVIEVHGVTNTRAFSKKNHIFHFEGPLISPLSKAWHSCYPADASLPSRYPSTTTNVLCLARSELPPRRTRFLPPNSWVGSVDYFLSRVIQGLNKSHRL